MRPAVVRDLVPQLDDLLARLRMALDGEAGHEPRRADAMRAQQIEDAAGTNEAKLAARERGGCGHAASNEP
jgi:hypothetical protein